VRPTSKTGGSSWQALSLAGFWRISLMSGGQSPLCDFGFGVPAVEQAETRQQFTTPFVGR